MKIYESSVKRPITTSLIFVAIIVFGLFSLSKLSIDLLPSFDMNQVMVIASYPGASAEDVETNVTKRLETTLSTVSDLKKITSTSKDNTSVVTIEFNWGTNLDAAVNDIRDKLELIKQALPDGCSTPMIFKLSTDMMPIVIYSVDAKESTAGLYKILDDNFSNPLQRIKGVGTVAIVGAPRREISVNVDPQKLEAYNLSVESIGSKIASENINTPAGNYDVGDETYSLRIEGEFKQSDLLKNIVVSDNGGRPVYLKDVATVRDSLQEKIQESYVNGKKGATIVVQKQNGANSVEVMNSIVKALPSIKQSLPSDIHITEIMNTTDNIKKSIGSLKETILLAFLFVVVVVLYFLGQWRAIIIVLITIPVSLIGAFIYLYASGNTLNVISLSAISIAIGMVVDDAIVVLENVTQHIERGALPREAAIYGTNEVATAVIASTLTLLAVFFPFTMVTGLAGIMFKQLGWMVCIVMVVSIICALSLTPMLCSLLLKKENKSSERFNKFYAPFKRSLDSLDNGYEKILSWAVRHKGKTITAAIILFVGSLLLMKVIGTEFVPASDNGQITGSIELPVGANVDRAKAVATRFQQEVKEKYPEIKNMTYTVGVPSDDESNAFSLMQSSGSNYISMRFRLSDLKDRKRNMFDISDSLRNDLKQYPEISKFNIVAGGSQGGSMTAGSNVDVEIIGYDFNTTTALANQFKKKMENIKGLKDVTISRQEYTPQFDIQFDREKLAENGLNVGTASAYIKNRMRGMTASIFRDEGDEYYVKVRYAQEFRQSVDDIENVVMYNNQGKAIRVGEVAKVVEKFAPPSIERQNRERIVKVSASIYGTTLDKATKALNQEITKMNIPSNVSVKVGGSIEDQQDTFKDLGTLAILIILLVYIVMASQFESLRSPFIIMFSVPFAITGSLISLWISGGTINMMSAIGVIMLIGIVVKNGIVLVDYINLNRERGMGIISAVVNGGKSRLRPVLMTTATTVLGMVPMAFGVGEGSELWQPMGVVIVGGLTVSTLVTLVLIPTIYCVFAARKVDRERKKMKLLNA